MRLTTVKWIDSVAGSILIVMIKPAVFLLGKLLKRDHGTQVRNHLYFVKLLGGGSLVIALPAILGLKRRYPKASCTLITTPSVQPFSDSLGVFNRIIIINDRSFIRILFSGVNAIIRCFKADTIIDLEVYSKLTTLFTTFTCARNRIGFFLGNEFWRKNLYTHLMFYNRYAGSFVFYDQIAYLLDAEPISVAATSRHLKALIPGSTRNSNRLRICISAGCSQLGRERMLTPEQWRRLFSERPIDQRNTEVIFLGGIDDRPLSTEIINRLSNDFESVIFLNLCGKMKLIESLALLRSADEFWGIDSALLHYARLFGVASLSLWGPTSPDTRLKPFPGLKETIRYQKIACSPCVHMAEKPPCRGNNICIQALFDPAVVRRKNISDVIGIH